MRTEEIFDRWQFAQDGGRPARTTPKECVGCGHSIHAVYACQGRPLFTREGRCGCSSHYGDLPPKWLP